jgi:hypothetical protein
VPVGDDIKPVKPHQGFISRRPGCGCGKIVSSHGSSGKTKIDFVNLLYFTIFIEKPLLWKSGYGFGNIVTLI